MIEDITERQRAEEGHMQFCGDCRVFQRRDHQQDPGRDCFQAGTRRRSTCSAFHRTKSQWPADFDPFWRRNWRKKRAGFWKKIKKGERMDHLETVRVRKDGSRIDVSVTTSPIKDLSGRITGVSSIYRNITELKRAETALRESEEYFRKMIESSPDAIFIHSEGKFVFLNRAGFGLFGATDPGQIVGRLVLDFSHPDYHQVIKERNRQLDVGPGGSAVAAGAEDRAAGREGGGGRGDWHRLRLIGASRRRSRWWRGTSPSASGRRRRCVERARRRTRSSRRFRNLIPTPCSNSPPTAPSIIPMTRRTRWRDRWGGGRRRSWKFAAGDHRTGQELFCGLARACCATKRPSKIAPSPWIALSDHGQWCRALLCRGRHRAAEPGSPPLRQAQKMESVGDNWRAVSPTIFNNILTVIQGHTSLLKLSPLPEEAQDSARQTSGWPPIARLIWTPSVAHLQPAADHPAQERGLERSRVSNMTRMLRRLLGEDINAAGELRAESAADPRRSGA